MVKCDWKKGYTSPLKTSVLCIDFIYHRLLRIKEFKKKNKKKEKRVQLKTSFRTGMKDKIMSKMIDTVERNILKIAGVIIGYEMTEEQ